MPNKYHNTFINTGSGTTTIVQGPGAIGKVVNNTTVTSPSHTAQDVKARILAGQKRAAAGKERARQAKQRVSSVPTTVTTNIFTCSGHSDQNIAQGPGSVGLQVNNRSVSSSISVSVTNAKEGEDFSIKINGAFLTLDQLRERAEKLEGRNKQKVLLYINTIEGEVSFDGPDEQAIISRLTKIIPLIFDCPNISVEMII